MDTTPLPTADGERRTILVGWSQQQLEKKTMDKKVNDLVDDKRVLRQKIKKPNGQLKGYMVSYPDSLVIGDDGIKTICVGFSLCKKGERHDSGRGYETAIRRAWKHRYTKWAEVKNTSYIPIELMKDAEASGYWIPEIKVYDSVIKDLVYFIARSKKYFGKNEMVEFPEWVYFLDGDLYGALQTHNSVSFV